MYMYIWRLYVYVYWGGVHTCLYWYIYVCIWIYMPVFETHACSSIHSRLRFAGMHICMYWYEFACIISIYMYVYVYMCIYVHLCRFYTINMFISACTWQIAVAQWHIQPHMTVQTGVRTPTTTKAFCFRKDFLLLGKFISKTSGRSLKDQFFCWNLTHHQKYMHIHWQTDRYKYMHIYFIYIYICIRIHTYKDPIHAYIHTHTCIYIISEPGCSKFV